jgi:hypothetical protein
MYAVSTEPAIVEKPNRCITGRSYDTCTYPAIARTGSHRQMDSQGCQEVDVRSNKTCAFALPDEARQTGDNSLCTRDAHGLEEKPRVGRKVTPIHTIYHPSHINVAVNFAIKHAELWIWRAILIIYLEKIQVEHEEDIEQGTLHSTYYTSGQALIHAVRGQDE